MGLDHAGADMSVTELQDLTNSMRGRYENRRWTLSAPVCNPAGVCLGFAEATDKDFLIAATRLICEAKRIREGAR